MSDVSRTLATALGVAMIASLALASACRTPAPLRPGKVGVATRALHDDSRRAWHGEGPWPLNTTIWYPAAPDAIERDVALGPPGLPFMHIGRFAADAAPAHSDRPLPLVLLSHGTGGSALNMSWLAQWLAANGIIAAAVTHHGNSIADRDLTPQGFFLFWERAPDLSRVLDALLADPVFGERIDPSRIGAAGFSLGGNTVALLAGARLDIQAYYALCSGPDARAESCAPPPESPFDREDFERMIDEDARTRASIARADDSYRDSRIRAAYALAPAVVDAFARLDPETIGIPLRIVVGTRDHLAPAGPNARALAAVGSVAELVEIQDVGHYTFLPRCGWAGRLLLGEICDEPGGIDRGTIHRAVAADALTFFEGALRGATRPSR